MSTKLRVNHILYVNEEKLSDGQNSPNIEKIRQLCRVGIVWAKGFRRNKTNQRQLTKPLLLSLKFIFSMNCKHLNVLLWEQSERWTHPALQGFQKILNYVIATR